MPVPHDRFERDPSVVYREIGGESILVPIRQNVGDLESIYTLNETAARIWGLCDGRLSLREICQVVVGEFDVDQDTAEADLLELASQLEGIGALRQV